MPDRRTPDVRLGHGVDLAQHFLGRDDPPEGLDLACQLLTAAAGAFLRHQQARLQLRAGAAEFRLRDMGLDLAQFSQHDRHQFGDLAFAGAGVDAEQAAVLERRGKRVDRIHQSALFANLLEQPRRHAAAQERRKQHGRVIIRIGIAHGGEPEDHVHLVEVAFFAEFPALVRRVIEPRRRTARQVGEMLLDQIENFLMAQLAGRGDDDVAVGVVAAHVSGQHRPRHVPDRLLRTQNRSAKGLVRDRRSPGNGRR